ncbi:MAG TPA: heme o synthase [bacterium]|nr:heme o synthase [bacterium]HMW36018.1 heme o synthase [bacterium]HMZ04927.1 heme o synthase [bacterium]HNB10621.1 heme o synthase [bacterium]HNE82694.1 heme o synthase [bacterium]
MTITGYYSILAAIRKLWINNCLIPHFEKVRHGMKEILKSYLTLTKPTIMLLVVFTGATALIVEGSFLHEPVKFILVLVGLYLTGGCANGLNQFFERDIDAKMERTKSRRPLPGGILSPMHALIFCSIIGVSGVILFAVTFNWLTAILSLATILFYSFFYTLYLKPNTSQNIVIGGAAGAMAPVGAWAAATNTMAPAPWIMFLIVFFWTPPHFWALALFCKNDYIKAKLPMMPVVKGDDSTLRQMFYYSLVLVVTTLALIFFKSGWIYAVTAIILGFFFVKKAYDAMKYKTEKIIRGLFGYSIVYLFALFLAMIVDSLVA